MSGIDSLAVGLYFVVLLLIGWFSGKGSKNQEDYFLASRSMPWIPVALSVAATMISANGFVGSPGWAYTDGMFPFMVNITVPFAIFISLYITTPVIYHLKVTSIYQYVERRLGNRTRILTILQFFVNSLIQASAMIYIPVLIIHTMTGWSLYFLIPTIVLISIIYTLMGGIKAVIWTDALQMIVVLGGVFVIIVVALQGMDLNLKDALLLAKEGGKLRTLDFRTDLSLTNTFWATLIGGAFMWIRYFSFDQVQVQRILTAKSLKKIKNSYVFSAFMTNITYFLMLFIGVLLFLFFQGRSFDNSNEIMITFVLEHIPNGIKGLIIAGVLASAMSSIDSLLNSMSVVMVKDIYEYYFVKDKKESSLQVSKLITLILGVFITVIIFIGFTGTVKSILEVVGSYISYFAGPAAGVFLLAMFTERANDKGSSYGFLLGLLLGFAISKTFHLSWLWNPALGAIITVVAGYGISLITKPDKSLDEIRFYTAKGIKAAIWKDKEHRTALEKEELPFIFGKHEAIILGFFIVQYILLAILQYT